MTEHDSVSRPAAAVKTAYAIPADAEELCELYLDAVYRYIRRRVESEADAEDLTSDTMAAACAQLSRFRGDCPVEYWLYGIARRQISSLRRRFRRRREVPIDAHSVESTPAPPSADPAHRVIQEERYHRMRQLVASLKSDHREVLLLKYREGLSLDQIAALLGRSHAAVNSLLQRARSAVREKGRAYFLDLD
ncbi:MAG: RNA polymerase sigma factor [Armatimonadota bacterium]